ncbi:MAG: hypothetical protein ACR2QC_12430, partial [Gammaproteobacteria bacterium]
MVSMSSPRVETFAEPPAPDNLIDFVVALHAKDGSKVSQYGAGELSNAAVFRVTMPIDYDAFVVPGIYILRGTGPNINAPFGHAGFETVLVVRGERTGVFLSQVLYDLNSSASNWGAFCRHFYDGIWRDWGPLTAQQDHLEVNQPGHGINPADTLPTPVRYVTGTGWVPAQADVTANLHQAYAKAKNSSDLMIWSGGILHTGTHGVPLGETRYLDAGTAGAVITTVPSISKRAYTSISTNQIWLHDDPDVANVSNEWVELTAADNGITLDTTKNYYLRPGTLAFSITLPTPASNEIEFYYDKSSTAIVTIARGAPSDTIADGNDLQVAADSAVANHGWFKLAALNATDWAVVDPPEQAAEDVQAQDLHIVAATEAADATARSVPQLTTVVGMTATEHDAIAVEKETVIDGRTLLPGLWYFPTTSAAGAATVTDLVRLADGQRQAVFRGDNGAPVSSTDNLYWIDETVGPFPAAIENATFRIGTVQSLAADYDPANPDDIKWVEYTSIPDPNSPGDYHWSPGVDLKVGGDTAFTLIASDRLQRVSFTLTDRRARHNATRRARESFTVDELTTPAAGSGWTVSANPPYTRLSKNFSGSPWPNPPYDFNFHVDWRFTNDEYEFIFTDERGTGTLNRVGAVEDVVLKYSDADPPKANWQSLTSYAADDVVIGTAPTGVAETANEKYFIQAPAGGRPNTIADLDAAEWGQWTVIGALQVLGSGVRVVDGTATENLHQYLVSVPDSQTFIIPRGVTQTFLLNQDPATVTVATYVGSLYSEVDVPGTSKTITLEGPSQLAYTPNHVLVERASGSLSLGLETQAEVEARRYATLIDGATVNIADRLYTWHALELSGDFEPADKPVPSGYSWNAGVWQPAPNTDPTVYPTLAAAQAAHPAPAAGQIVLVDPPNAAHGFAPGFGWFLIGTWAYHDEPALPPGATADQVLWHRPPGFWRKTVVDTLSDADGDTHVRVEATPDADAIVFEVAGQNAGTWDASG